MSLSVIVITYNEEHNISACLQSVSWADEIIVLDSGSQDKTVELAKQFTDQVFVTDWPGYGIQKQRALEKANGDWVLSLDADERVSPQLKAAIQAATASCTGSYAAYKVKRPLVFRQRVIKFANGKSYHLCLFQREKAQFTRDVLHEGLQVQGNVGTIPHPLFHYSYQSIDDLCSRMHHYSSLSASQRKQSGKKVSVFKAISHGVWMFVRIYLLRLGFLDGSAGFILAVSNAEGSYYKYLKQLD